MGDRGGCGRGEGDDGRGIREGYLEGEGVGEGFARGDMEIVSL